MKPLVVRIWVVVLLVVCRQATAEVRDIQMHSLGIDKGLSHQSVNCFCQDEFGFIWIGTTDGLNRYDGYTVDVFRPDDAPYSIASNNIRQLYCDQRGSIYIRSHSRIERYDQRLKRFETIYEGDVQTMACDSRYIYLVDKEQIWRIDHREESSRKKPVLIYSFANADRHPDAIKQIVISDSGLILASAKLGIVELVEDHLVRRQPIYDVNSLVWDPQMGLWVLTRGNGLFCFDRAWQERCHYTNRSDRGDNTLLHNNVRSIVPVGNNCYYVGSFGGLQLLNVERGEFTRYEYELANNLKIRSILTLFYDNRQTLWVGTFHGGAQYHHHANAAFRFYRIRPMRSSDASSPMVCAIAEDDRGMIWLGTEGNGLICFDPEHKTFDQVRGIPSDEVIKDLYFDARRREMWAATLSHGVIRIDLNRHRVDYVGPSVLDVITGRSVGSTYNITSIVDDGLGNLLVCSNLGLVRLDREQMRFEAIDNEAFFRRSVSQIWEVAYQGDFLWMATSFDLIRLSRSTGRVRHYSFADILGRSAQQHIAHLLVDGVGTLYLGASGAGLFRYDAERDSFDHIGPEQGLVNGFITAMSRTAPTTQDLAGVVYVGHSHGISWLGPTGEMENYNLMNNSPLSTVNENGLYVTRDNNLLVCGLQGLLVIRPDAMTQRTSDYDIYVKDVLVDNRSVMPLDSLHLMEASSFYQDHLELPSRYSSVTFEVAQNSFHRLPAFDMEYRLEGYDGDFMTVEHGGSITYQNLPAGNYRLVVRAAGVEQGEHRPQTTFSLRVKAPIYARTWFLLLIAVVVIAVGLKILQLWLHRQKLEKMLHLEQVNAQKLRFFTNLSHEFRTPLTLIMGQVEMLLARQDMNPSIYNKVLGIYRNTQRLKGMVDEIIDIRRLDQSRLHLLVARYDLAAALTVIWHSFQDFATQHQIELTFEAPSEPVEAEFDTRQLERVINNLLSNAFKYTKSGGSIAIRLTCDGNEACIAVSDTGIGIATEHLNHIFERFWQEERANASIEQYGSGIGLSLAKNLMEMHDGRIEVKSRRGKGTTFYVYLPLTMRRDNPHAAFIEADGQPEWAFEDAQISMLSAEPATEQEGGVRPKVVLVEDNAEMRELLRQIFEPYYRVSLAKQGVEGLELVRSEQPELVVSDVMMPEMTGFELCKRLKTEFETSHIPVVLLTAYTKEEHMIDGLLTGADDYIAKPFNARILLARCNNIIEQRRRLQTRYGQSADEDASMLTSHPQDRRLLEEVSAVLEDHLSDSEFDVADFARELRLSRTMLFAKLKGITGQTPNEFILSYRLNRAKKRLLEDGAVTVAEIAYDCGFSTPSYFIRCFRSRYGATPNVWRKQSRAEEA